MWHIIDYIQLKLKGYKSIGHVRYKNESLAPKEWKISIWEKIKNNALLTPVNINHSENYKEIKIFIKGKVIIIAINIFLLSFSYSFIKDTYTITKAQITLNNRNNIDYKKEIPEQFVKIYEAKKRKLSQYKKENQIEKVKTLNQELILIDSFFEYIENKAKNDLILNNSEAIKSNALSFANNLLMIYLITKYYWKNKRRQNP